ncbi:Toluene tolerance family protein [Syntrophobacter sp. SbD1]|nr:Toluene tolerance family protein [Syntrophobacter sp. SbD1]
MIAAYSHLRWVSRRPISKTLISVLCLCLWASQAIAVENPQAVIKTGTDQVIQLLKRYPENTRARREIIRAVVVKYVDEYFDFDEISKLTLGAPWNEQPPEKQQQFTRDFSQLLFSTYIGKIEKFTNEKITYNQKQIAGNCAIIEALEVGDQCNVPIDYYLRLKDGKWKVYDVSIEGIGLVTNYRSQFESILLRKSFDDLLRQLKEKLAAQG